LFDNVLEIQAQLQGQLTLRNHTNEFDVRTFWDAYRNAFSENRQIIDLAIFILDFNF
jgi:hypothetical protein